jgi:hypothetical protein
MSVCSECASPEYIIRKCERVCASPQCASSHQPRREESQHPEEESDGRFSKEVLAVRVVVIV